MVEVIKENGYMLKWMEKGNLFGLIIKDIKVIYRYIYIGSYINGRKEGYGEFYWPDGKYYKGYWKNGTMHGGGTYKDG